jgi:hypothetical protein
VIRKAVKYKSRKTQKINAAPKRDEIIPTRSAEQRARDRAAAKRARKARRKNRGRS